MHNRSTLSLLVLGSLALVGGALVIACGSDDKGSPDSVSSVDSDKVANTLSDSEAKEYCEDAQKFYADNLASLNMKRITCGYTAQLTAGIGAADDAAAQAACRTKLDECMNKPSETADAGTSTGDDKDDCSTAKNDLKDCTAKVADLNQCAADQVAAYKALESKDWCAAAKAGTPTSTDSPFTTPESCTKLSNSCPSITGGSDDSDG